MFASERSVRLLVVVLVVVGVSLACSLPLPAPGSPEPGVTPPPELPVETAAPATEAPTVEPMVVTHQGANFNIYTLTGTLVETRSAAGMEYARPNTAQVVGDAVDDVDSGGSSLGGVVRRVTSAGTETLGFTAADPMAYSISFAVSDDGSRIAWTHASWGEAGATSQLWTANIDGSNTQLAAQSSPNDEFEEFFVLEAVRWTSGGDLIYAWQISGIGGYILFFGWSSFYLYSPASGTSTAWIPALPGGTGPCWYTVSPDQVYAVGSCDSGTGVPGMRERLASGSETVFPVLPNQGQQGAADYSPSGTHLAYAIAVGNYESEAGQVIVRLNRGEAPVAIASHSPGYFDRILWIDEGRMAVGYLEGEAGHVDLLGLDGTRSPIGDGRLIGLMRPIVAAAAGSGEGLAGQVDRGDLTVEDVTASGDIAGPGIEVVVRNPGPVDV